MNIDLSDPKAIVGAFIFSLFIFAYLVELFTGRIAGAKRPFRDMILTITGFSSQSILNGGVIGALAGFSMVYFFPGSANSLAETPFWIAFPIIFFAQEFAHYWIHRFAHEWRWLWRLHRTHHSATDMNVGVVFRYNVFWVLLLPQAWFAAFGIYFGLGWAVLAALATTFMVNVLTHSSYRWDLYLREKMPWSEPAWKIIERYITLPDIHHAHHAYGKNAHPNGNYAVTLFVFDRMFGTAKIPNARQETMGLPISERLHLAEEMFWPLVRKPLKPKDQV